MRGDNDSFIKLCDIDIRNDLDRAYGIAQKSNRPDLEVAVYLTRALTAALQASSVRIEAALDTRPGFSYKEADWSPEILG